MAMSKKHYVKTAAILAGERAIVTHALDESARIAISAITYSLADMFAQDNPRFDRATFYAAAGQPVK